MKNQLKGAIQTAFFQRFLQLLRNKDYEKNICLKPGLSQIFPALLKKYLI